MFSVLENGVFSVRKRWLLTLTPETVDAYDGTNNLKATDGSSNVEGKYRLGYNSTDGVGFYPYSTTVAPAAGIVNLDVDVAEARCLKLIFDDETTGIADVRRQM